MGPGLGSSTVTSMGLGHTKRWRSQTSMVALSSAETFLGAAGCWATRATAAAAMRNSFFSIFVLAWCADATSTVLCARAQIRGVQEFQLWFFRRTQFEVS